MPHFDKILFPVDFSTQCLQTASYVAEVAKKFSSSVTLLHVLDTENPFGYGSLSSTTTYGTDVLGLRAQHEKQITSFAASAFSGLRANRVIAFGKPAEEIVRYACEHNMSLVLMPTHGYGDFKKLFLGSVTSEVLCRAELRKSLFAFIVLSGFGPERANKRATSIVMKPRTRETLITAMNCDALDAAKYGRFAARARMDQDWQLARVFQDSADIDRANHFQSEAELEGAISNSPDNLRAAVDTERREAAMLSNFAEQGAADGDHEVTSVFRKISQDKAERLARFEAELEQLGVHSDIHTLS